MIVSLKCVWVGLCGCEWAAIPIASHCQTIPNLRFIFGHQAHKHTHTHDVFGLAPLRNAFYSHRITVGNCIFVIYLLKNGRAIKCIGRKYESLGQRDFEFGFHHFNWNFFVRPLQQLFFYFLAFAFYYKLLNGQISPHIMQ